MGNFLAELSIVYANQELARRQVYSASVHTVSLKSPGHVGTVKALADAGVEAAGVGIMSRADITGIFSAPNIINSLESRFGTVLFMPSHNSGCSELEFEDTYFPFQATINVIKYTRGKPGLRTSGSYF